MITQAVAASVVLFVIIRQFARPPPKTMTKEWQEAGEQYLKVHHVYPLAMTAPFMLTAFRNKKSSPSRVFPRRIGKAISLSRARQRRRANRQSKEACSYHDVLIDVARTIVCSFTRSRVCWHGGFNFSGPTSSYNRAGKCRVGSLYVEHYTTDSAACTKEKITGNSYPHDVLSV